MKKQRNANRQTTPQPPHKKPDRRAVGLLLVLAAVTVVVLTVYRLLMKQPYFRIVMIAYMILATGFALAYVIYNRGFSRKGVTEEMLPAEWSEEQKTEFIEDGKRRLKQSRWMIVPIFAFLITFGVDALELFVFPFFRGLFS